MKARWMGTDLASSDDVPEKGDIGLGAANYHGGLMICCPVCGWLDVINCTDPNRLKWDWDQATLTLSPSVKVTAGASICHYNLTNGVFIIHGDSTK
jgi:hypothetical protein